jgi:hypothetical protein
MLIFSLHVKHVLFMESIYIILAACSSTDDESGVTSSMRYL